MIKWYGNLLIRFFVVFFVICLKIIFWWCECRVIEMNFAWLTIFCAEVGGKVALTFVMQALECGHLTSSIVRGSLASRPVAAFVLLCGKRFYSFYTHITTTSICRVCRGIYTSSCLLSNHFLKIRSHLLYILVLILRRCY